MMSPAEPPPSRLVTIDEVAAYTGDPLYLFIGVSTEGSSVHTTFPLWAPTLAPGGVLGGLDLPPDADPAQFRRLLLAMRNNPAVHGAVVTSHKLRLYRAAYDLLDFADPLVEITHEINSLDSKRGLRGFARDPQSLDLVLDTVGDTPGDAVDASANRQRPIICIGAGGSAIALLLAVGLDVSGSLAARRPVQPAVGRGRGPLTIVGRSERSLDEVASVRERAGLADAAITLRLAAGDQLADLISQAAPGTIIANATGLGKTEPGSPLPSSEAFPPGTLAWDFNYRGPLTFLEQARAAGVATEDGWDYFLAGWTAALAAIGDQPATMDVLNAVREASRSSQPG